MVKLLCERCGRVYGAFCVGLELVGTVVFVGLCFDCEYEEQGEIAGPLDGAS